VARSRFSAAAFPRSIRHCASRILGVGHRTLVEREHPDFTTLA